MNKHELKSLLENIYEAMILPTLGQELYANPALFKPTTPTLPPNRVPPPPPPLKPIWPMTTGLDRLTKSMKRLRDAFPFPNSPPFQTEQADTMNKQELKSLLENIYTALTEADIPDNPPAPPGWEQNSPEPWPWPRNPTSPTPPPPTLPPNGMTPFLPRMPLDPNGNPLFPSQKFWAEYYRALRALPMGATMITHPAEMERFRELTRQLQEWQRQQQQQRPQPNDGGPLG